VDFAKKLMGQIVFLYFLQKKGWLGVTKGKDWGTGPHDFLRRLARGEHGGYQNLFNDVLEPLFYDTLATDRGHEAWCKRFNCRIPFLNGGLFEPLGDYDWKKVDIELPNRLFTNAEHTEAGDIGTGILDVFDRYNFTVNEAEPLEKEVAIDPEMLGKVFENLIEENRRRGLGSYYTPREIVHYMCQESLINYLDTAVNNGKETISRADLETFVHLGEQISHYEAVETRYAIKMPKSIEQQARLIDEKLAEITVCDPAVGSGAFPVGMMMEVVRARCALTPYFNDFHERTPYHFKRHAIQNCLYGVDIDPGAIEIAKLRLWLSLVVDEEDVLQIKPLPNLEYKIVVGNSLLGFPFKSRRLHEVETLKRHFFAETDYARKASLNQKIAGALEECFRGAQRALGYSVTFDFEINFSEIFDAKGGFDVVIGNPPYISAVVHAKADESLRNAYRRRYPLLKGAFDVYTVFLLQGVKITNGKGAYTWIIPNKFLVSNYSKSVLEHLKQNGLRSTIDVSTYGVFENTGVYPVILIGSKPAESFVQYEIGDLADLQHNRLTKRTQLKTYETFKDHHIKISSGTTGFQAQAIRRYLCEKPSVGALPFVVSGCVDRYHINFNGVRYMGHTYEKAFIKKNASVAESKWQFWCKEKIVIAGMTKTIEAVYYTDPLALGVGVYAIHDYGTFDPRFLLALLNSKYLSYYLNVMFKDKHLAGGYLAINKSTIEQLPLKQVSAAEQHSIAEIVDQILSMKRRDQTADTRKLETKIDRFVYKLYGVNNREAAIVEQSYLGD
jgi:hypothetical protein